jgi:hypothetical protein
MSNAKTIEIYRIEYQAEGYADCGYVKAESVPEAIVAGVELVLKVRGKALTYVGTTTCSKGWSPEKGFWGSTFEMLLAEVRILLIISVCYAIFPLSTPLALFVGNVSMKITLVLNRAVVYVRGCA